MFRSPKQRITSESLQRVREYWNARENDSATALDPEVKSVTKRGDHAESRTPVIRGKCKIWTVEEKQSLTEIST